MTDPKPRHARMTRARAHAVRNQSSDVGGETVPCVAGWGEDGALEAVTEFAETIDELARRIESALREALDRALVAAQLGVRRWAAVPQDPARTPRSAAMTAIIYYEGATLTERDGYEHGVPCWIDTWQEDPATAATF